MTAPVDIAAAVELVVESVPPRELAANLLASMANSEDLLAAFGRIRARLGLGDDDPTTTEDAVYALADERRDIEQRTAEAIAKAFDGAWHGEWAQVLGGPAALIRSGKWRTP